MALTLGDLVAYLKVDDSDFRNKVGRSESRWSKLNTSIGAGATAIGAGVATAIGAAGAIGISTASQMEQANIGFTTMLGSAEKARSFLGDLQKFAAATPFEFPELQTAASSLISVGIKADDVIPIMRTLGDVTAGMGTGSEGIQRATVALQQMTAAGRIQAEDLNQLRDAGIPVYDLLAKALGKSKAEVADLASKGKLGQDALDKMMKALTTGGGLERFSGLMEKQSHSLAGLWSTVKDTFGQGMAQAIAPVIPLLKDGLGGAASFLGDVLPKVTSGLQSFVGLLRDIGDWMGEHQTTAQLLGITIGTVLAGAFTIWGVAAMLAAARNVAAWLSVALSSQTGAAAAERSSAQVALGWAAMGLSAVIQGTRIAVVWATQIIASAVSGAAAFLLSAGRVVAGWVLMGVQSMIQAARMAAAWLIAMGPVGWVIAAVVGLVALVIANWQTVKKWTVAAWNGVVAAVKFAVGIIVSWFMHWTLPGLIISHWDTIKRVFSAGVSAVVGFVRTLPERIRSFFAGIGSWLINAGRSLLEGLWNGMSGAAGWLWSKVKGWASGLLGNLKGIFEWGSPSKLFERYGGWLMQGMGRGIDRHAGAATSAALSAAGSISGALQVPTPAFGAAGASLGAGGGYTPAAQRPPVVHVYLDGQQWRGMARAEAETATDRALGAVHDTITYAGGV